MKVNRRSGRWKSTLATTTKNLQHSLWNPVYSPVFSLHFHPHFFKQLLSFLWETALGFWRHFTKDQQAISVDLFEMAGYEDCMIFNERISLIKLQCNIVIFFTSLYHLKFHKLSLLHTKKKRWGMRLMALCDGPRALHVNLTYSILYAFSCIFQH